MRARNIKPGFFKCLDLAEIDFASRLLFIGLWCYADREGRFKWEPKRIKAEIFPYDDINIDKLLCNLMSLHFITRNDNVGYVENFKKHQSPHPHEAKSVLPEKSEQNQCHDKTVTLREMSPKSNADVRIEDSLIPDSLIEDTGREAKPRRFAPPTTEQVDEYMQEIEFDGDAERFVSYYESNGWMVGRSKMKDWRAAVRTWRGKEKAKPQPPNRLPPHLRQQTVDLELLAAEMRRVK